MRILSAFVAGATMAGKRRMQERDHHNNEPAMTVQTLTPTRRFRGQPRGRELETDLLIALRERLGDEREHPELARRDLLIEHLHVLQDAHGHLALPMLRALAAYMNLPMAAVYETATFYAHFDVVHDDQAPPPGGDGAGLRLPVLPVGRRRCLEAGAYGRRGSGRGPRAAGSLHGSL